jgi:ssDNA-binding replication factor A large subunit
MSPSAPKLSEIRPGMEHLTFKVKVTKVVGIRKVKTYSGVEHSILEGEIIEGAASIGFAVWNEKIELFKEIVAGDTVELTDCFVTSFKGVLQVNVGRDSDAKKVEA